MSSENARKLLWKERMDGTLRAIKGIDGHLLTDSEANFTAMEINDDTKTHLSGTVRTIASAGVDANHLPGVSGKNYIITNDLPLFKKVYPGIKIDALYRGRS